MKAKRVFLIVLDSLGIGAAPDAELFGDAGTNTLKRISASPRFSADNLTRLGLGHIDGVDYIEKTPAPTAAVARLTEISSGKDTTTGHWELMGLISRAPMPTYPEGFPEKIIKKFEAAVGRGVLCNKPYSGTEVIRDYGAEHEKSGSLIVYTSADSVFQIAAHEDVVPLGELYAACREARKILTGEDSVGRVIARPFITENGAYKRTANRRDFSLLPPRKSLLNALSEVGLDVIAVGKIEDIFAGYGITEAYHSHSNAEGMEITKRLKSAAWEGLCFVNLVDFDSQYGHRQDVDGYAAALAEFDGWLGEFVGSLSEGEVLMITADHGCDPGDDDTDHSREYVPLLIYGDGIEPENLGTLRGFGNVAEMIAEMLSVDFSPEEE